VTGRDRRFLLTRQVEIVFDRHANQFLKRDPWFSAQFGKYNLL
jgi:hypothetical protein